MPRAAPRRPLRLLLLAAALLLVAGAGAVAWIVAGGDGRRDEASRAPTPTFAPPAATSPPTSPGASTPSGADPAGFPTGDCRPLAPAGDGALGLGIPRPARLTVVPAERAAFDAAAACLRAMGGGAPPVLRTQLPIDVLRRTVVGGDERAELQAFGTLLAAAPAGTRAIVSVRAHDFTRCGRRGAPPARERLGLAPAEPLQACEYPSIALYRELFAELHAAVIAATPGIDVRFTAWNEPDHPTFTLLDAFGEVGAARRAGEYWTQAAAVAGPEAVMAGEFADRDLPTLLRLRTAFVEGAGGVAPPVWAIHPYRDLTSPAAQHVVDGFEQAVAPAPVWLTEVGSLLSGRTGISGEPGAQRARGETLRRRIERTPTRVVLYLLTPPPAPQSRDQDGFDSAIADRSARARPFLCGLAALPAARCPGDPAKFGG